jgi:hypothetical protein
MLGRSFKTGQRRSRAKILGSGAVAAVTLPAVIGSSPTTSNLKELFGKLPVRAGLALTGWVAAATAPQKEITPNFGCSKLRGTSNASSCNSGGQISAASGERSDGAGVFQQPRSAGAMFN